MSTSVRRSVMASLFLTSLLFAAIPAFATEAESETPAETDAPAVNVPTPAIAVPEDPPADTTPEWSYRFLVPVTMVLGFLAVVATIFMYFVRVTKNRYRVVE